MKCTGEIRPEFAVHRQRFPRACERFLIGRPAGPDWLRRFGSERGRTCWKTPEMGVAGRAPPATAIHAHTTAHTMAAITTSSVTAVRAVKGARATFGSRAAFAAPSAKASKARFVCRAEGEVR